MTAENQNFDIERSIRELALQGLEIETLREFDFVMDEEGEVWIELEIDECTDVLAIHSVTFEFLYNYFAQSKGLDLTGDEFIITLIKIEHFIQDMEDEFICDDCAEKMAEVAPVPHPGAAIKNSGSDC
jgi:hypothetical protein